MKAVDSCQCIDIKKIRILKYLSSKHLLSFLNSNKNFTEQTSLVLKKYLTRIICTLTQVMELVTLLPTNDYKVRF